jgi:uncharacterized membrane protein
MRTPAQIAGHPIHPMLVTIPIGLWIFSLVCDFIAMRSGTPDAWATASFYAMVGGIIGALAAALPGLVDLLSLRKTPILPTAVKHMALNLTIVVLYVINAWMRWGQHTAAPGGATLILSLVAIAMLLVSGWLGGKMVYEAGVAVHAEDMGTTAVRERAVPDRGAAWGSTATGLGREHAMASDPSRPGRDPLREDRPSAGRTPENPRE